MYFWRLCGLSSNTIRPARQNVPICWRPISFRKPRAAYISHVVEKLFDVCYCREFLAQWKLSSKARSHCILPRVEKLTTNLVFFALLQSRTKWSISYAVIWENRHQLLVQQVLNPNKDTTPDITSSGQWDLPSRNIATNHLRNTIRTHYSIRACEATIGIYKSYWRRSSLSGAPCAKKIVWYNDCWDKCFSLLIREQCFLKTKRKEGPKKER